MVRQRQTAKRLTRILTGILGAVLLSAPAMAQEDAVLRPVKLIELSGPSVSVERTFFGRVVARQTVDLAFQVGGQILQIPAVEGAEVRKGDLIAELDLEPFELAKAEAEERLDQATRTVTRFEQLQGAAVSEVALRDARTDLRLAELAEQDAQRALRLATLRAPFDGLVAERLMANFNTISAGTPVVRLHDMSETRVEIDVPEVLFQRAGKDPDMDITGTFPADDRAYPLVAREFVAETSRVGQTYQITLAFAAPLDREALPGTSVTVRAQLNEQQTGIPVPTSAIVDSGDNSKAVFVFTPTGADEGTVSLRPVELEVAAGGGFALLSGVEPGEEIVAAGVNLLTDGQRVARFAGFAD